MPIRLLAALAALTLTPILTCALPMAAHAAPPPAYAVTDRIAGPDGGWDLLGVDPAAGRLYVARHDAVMAVDLQSKAVTPRLIPLQGGHAALPIPGTARVLATNGAANTAVLFDGKTGKAIATLPTGKRPDGAVYDPATRTAWVMDPGEGAITVIDPATAKVVATVPVGGSLELGAADGAGRMYVNIEDKNEVAVLDTRARKLVTTFPLKGCEGPTGLAYAPDARLIVSACANGVAVVSAPDGREVASLKIGPHPDGAAYDARRKLALVPSGGDGTLAVIRLTPTPEVVATVQTAKGARTIAIDPSTGKLYLPSAAYQPPVGTARPAMTPGSFAVLVVSPQ